MGVLKRMVITNDLRRKLFFAVSSAVVATLAAHLWRKVLGSKEARSLVRKAEEKLDLALESTMDCSDPIAKF